MKKSVRIHFFIALLCPLLLKTEFLIVQKDSNSNSITAEFSPEAEAKIKEIILKYQWPQCLIADLTSGEIDELLSPNQPYAEEKFIEKKLQAALGNNIQVIFVPTTLYELALLLPNITGNPVDFKRLPEESVTNKQMVSILNSGKAINDIKKEFFNQYRKDNNAYFDRYYFTLNKKLHKFFFSFVPQLPQAKNSQEAAEIIKNVTYGLVRTILDDARALKHPEFGTEILFHAGDPHELINQIIKLEYDARSINKALLYRGTQFFEKTATIFNESTTMLLAGSTKKKSYDRPYSASFGNSLFAGIYNDWAACVFPYLMNQRLEGYAVLIDKKEQMLSSNSNLFFISPLMTLASFFGGGEFFHSRSKAAVTLKEDHIEIAGMHSNSFADKAAFFLITRDPQKHDALFSQFLADNLRLINPNSDREKVIRREQQLAASAIKLQGKEEKIEQKLKDWKTQALSKPKV